MEQRLLWELDGVRLRTAAGEAVLVVDCGRCWTATND
jgi:hypothetical protein